MLIDVIHETIHVMIESLWMPACALSAVVSKRVQMGFLTVRALLDFLFFDSMRGVAVAGLFLFLTIQIFDPLFCCADIVKILLDR